MAGKEQVMNGFQCLSEGIYARGGGDETASSKGHGPDIIVIYGWGDSLPKHVAKYTAGYQALFPCARQIVVLSSFRKALFTNRQRIRERMEPLVSHVFGFPDQLEAADGVHDDKTPRKKTEKIILHAMSNVGSLHLTATFDAYRERFGRAMPHNLIVWDSAPSWDQSWDNARRFARALSVGFSQWIPGVLMVAVESICLLFIVAMLLSLWAQRREHLALWGRTVMNQTSFVTKRARKLYIYSKDDELINYRSVEEHAAKAKTIGFSVDLKHFRGSGHVRHMQMHTEEYYRLQWVTKLLTNPDQTPNTDTRKFYAITLGV